MGQGFIDLYLQHEMTTLVWLLLIGSLLVVPRIIFGHIDSRKKARGEGFMAFPMQKRSVTVLQTVYRENPKVLEASLRELRTSLDKWTTMSSIICVIDAADLFPEEAEKLGAIAKHYGAYVFCTNARAKRENLKNGMAWAKNPSNHQSLVSDPRLLKEVVDWAKEQGVLYEICLMHDSDTIPTTPDNDIVGELLRPFADESIGCVTTAQRLTMVDSDLQEILDWLEEGRINTGMAMGSMFGQVVCPPGRLYAVRTELIVDWMGELVNEKWFVPQYSWSWPFVKFAWVDAHAGDDRRVGMRVQMMGKKVVMNYRAKVVTTMPRTLKKVCIVLWRWATSSQWLTVIGTVTSSAYRKLPVVMYLAWGDIAITFIANYLQLRFFWSLIEWLLGIGDPNPVFPLATLLLINILGVHLSFGLRQIKQLYSRPKRIRLLPMFILFVSLLQLIRLIPWIHPGRVNVWGSREGSGLRTEPLFFRPYDEWLTKTANQSRM